MHRKRSSLPIVFIISVAAIFIYSYHNSSLHLFVPENPRPNPLTSRQGPVTIPTSFTFTIKVLAFDRIESLRRCLRSLSNADYGGDRVNLHVYVDHFRDVETVNGSVVLDRKLEEAHRILDFLDEYKWGHGEKLVHYRTGNVGLQAQWLEAWWPVSNDEFAFIVEDDLEVSPLYYRYLKGLIAKYYYDPSNFSPLIYGASLQRPRFVAGKHGNKLQLDNETHLFLYQLVGTWGQLLFPNQWKEFRLWYDLHKAKGIKPVLQGMITTGWYKKMGERIWTPWFIKFIHSRSYYNIYTNFRHERALSISHRDAGVNYRKTAGPDSFLLGEENLVDSNYWKMQPLRDLKWYDFCFREVVPDRVVKSFDELENLLGSLQKQKTITLVSLYRTAGRLTRNLICHLERLNIHNCIFIGIDSESLLDLARRGYAVIDANHLIYGIRRFKLSGLQRSEVELVREILVKAYVIKKCLEYGYSSWLVDGNLVPATDGFPEVADQSYDFFTAEDMELLFVKNSPTSVKIWVDELIYKVAAAANSLKGNAVEHGRFVYLTMDALERAGGLKMAKGDELRFGVKLGGNSVNGTSAEGGKKMVFWSPEMGLDSTERELENMGMWLIDGDSSCTAVFCHKS